MTACLASCKKKPTAPVVSTAGVSEITQTTAASGGNVTGDGGTEVTARGVCWNTSENPTTTNSKTSDGKGEGAYVSSMTQLTPGTKYYIRAYSINEAGTGYGNQLSFTTGAIVLATLSTTAVTSITETTAVSGGNITSDGGGTVTAKGVCWSSTSQTPTTADSKTTDGSGTGAFTSNIAGLSPGTDYYVRAYATNSAGTSYGNMVNFPTSQGNGSGIIFNPTLTYGTVTDIDGNSYKTIQIGAKKGAADNLNTTGEKAVQEWLAQNLRTTKYNDGTDIPLVTDNTAWTNLTTPGYCWYNNGAGLDKEAYGALYNWYAVGTGKLCPTGWHVPSDAEWHQLVLFCDPSALLGTIESMTAGNKLRETGTTHWVSDEYEATNEPGLTALPGGYRYELGNFNHLGGKGYWWTSTEVQGPSGSISAWHREINALGNVNRLNYGKKTGFSVRCVKD
ncbi:MAG: fibrobacter succinogenes major paralogous domain-containing protein [Bacteroidales bacterium]|nr:fibrobacter succinogenes major paralogous domain-containing protein [Bacteroidales bacterium]